MSLTLDKLKKAFQKTLGSGMPHISNCSSSEREEYDDLIEITQTITGIEYIASNAEVGAEPLVAPFRDRMRALIIKDEDVGKRLAAAYKELENDASKLLDQIHERRKKSLRRMVEY